MAEKSKSKWILLPPKHRGSIPRAKILKAIKKVAAARRRRQQTPVADGAS